MSEVSAPAAQESATPEKKPVGGELIIPIAGLLFTAYYFTTITDSPWTAQVSAYFVGAILTFLVCIFLIKTFIAVSAGRTDLGLGPLIAPKQFVRKRLILFSLMLAYCYLVQFGGFTLTTFVFMTAGMIVLTDGGNKRFIATLCAFLAFGGWALFILAFDTRFPDGPFELLMEWLL